MKKNLYLAAALACACAGGACAQPAPSEVCGYVYSILGNWRVAPQYASEIKPGMALYVGDRVKLMTAARPAHINIGLLNGTVFGKDCDTERDCVDPLTLPAIRVEGSLSQRLRDLMSGFVAHRPPIVFTVSRGNATGPEEAELRFAGGRADLAPALRSAEAGVWDVKLLPVAPGHTVAEATCQWTRTKGTCPAEVADAGLYRLEVSAGDKPPQSVLVLIAAAGDYSRVADAFAEARRVADSWSAAVRPDARHYFLSAVLNELALPAPRKR